MKYSDLPHHVNPRTRIRELGGKSLSDSETLALAFWLSDTETASELARLYNEFGGLSKIPRHRITEIKGLGEKYADAIMAVIELTRRELLIDKPVRTKVTCPGDVASCLSYEMGSLDHEELRVVLLNTRNEIIRIVTVAVGSTNGASVRVSELFRDAIRENAVSIILVHNHPSGDPAPSPEDVNLTRCAISAGKNMDIIVQDHIVIGCKNYVSLRQRDLCSFN